MDPPKIRACLFDMDGLLLNTEDLITTCINTILHDYGKPGLPWSVKARIQGRTASESDVILQEWAQLPIPMDVYREQLYEIQNTLFPTAKPLPGVTQLLQDLQTKQSHGEVELALATSSSREKFALKSSSCISIFGCFSPDCRVLGDDPRVAEHKPAPDIYLCALKCVNDRLLARRLDEPIHARECLVFEDSIQGVEAGRRAGMQVVWCPHPSLLQELSAGTADDVRENLRSVLSLPPGSPIKNATAETLAEAIREATNGWITLVESLEDFELAKYGL